MPADRHARAGIARITPVITPSPQTLNTNPPTRVRERVGVFDVPSLHFDGWDPCVLPHPLHRNPRTNPTRIRYLILRNPPMSLQYCLLQGLWNVV